MSPWLAIFIITVDVLIVTICIVAMVEGTVARLIVHYFSAKEQYLQHLSKVDMQDQFKALQ